MAYGLIITTKGTKNTKGYKNISFFQIRALRGELRTWHFGDLLHYYHRWYNRVK
jgi:hypothetical protein